MMRVALALPDPFTCPLPDPFALCLVKRDKIMIEKPAQEEENY